VALAISLAILVMELLGGFIFRSSALIADALHVTTDILAIAFSFIALTISARPPSGTSTYGFHRVEVIASLVNGLSLVGVVAIIMFTAYTHFLNAQPINVLGTVAFAALALVLNLSSSRVLTISQSAFATEDKDQNISSAEKHVLGDAMSSLAVIVGAIGVYFTRLYFIDPLVAVLIGLIVLRSAIKITMQGGAIILERSPIRNLVELEKDLTGVAGVSDVHDFHAWRICSHITVASLHACTDAQGKTNPSAVRERLESKLRDYGVQHVTIQLEEVCCAPSHGHGD
jgi:cobalt-zinc-cadmium efflux system protein